MLAIAERFGVLEIDGWVAFADFKLGIFKKSLHENNFAGGSILVLNKQNIVTTVKKRNFKKLTYIKNPVMLAFRIQTNVS